jgi:D-alanyl-D-alanine carboxypeptidase (penicillin-binding protein 5/6)
MRKIGLLCLVAVWLPIHTFGQDEAAQYLVVEAPAPVATSAPETVAVNAPVIRSRAAVLLDAETSALLFSKGPDEEISPASLAKLMTMHIALSEVAAGHASVDEVVPLPMESWAVNQPPRSSLMFLAQGQQATLRELMLGLAIPSGNDAAVAVALRFAPSVDAFVDRMNMEAQSFGLSKTVFVEPSGVSENNMTTALEFAVFCNYYIQLHPETLVDYHSVEEFAYPKPENVRGSQRSRPGTIVQQNHNRLLGSMGVDGLKTGYIDEAGYNIALTAKQGETRLIAVILGAPASYGGDKIRDQDGASLLEWGFSHYKTLRPVIDELPPVRVWKGRQKQAGLALAEDAPFTTLVERGDGLRYETELDSPIIAPCAKGGVAGALVLYDSKGELRRIPLVFVEDVEQGGFWTRLWDSIRLFFRKLTETKTTAG